MPCVGNDYPPGRYEVLTAKAPAMLCALLRVLAGPARQAALGAIDWEKAGVTHAEFLEWQELHFALDRERVQREAQEKQQKKAREKAVSKLTAAERKILGV